MRVSKASKADTRGDIKSGVGMASSAARVAAMVKYTRVEMVNCFISVLKVEKMGRERRLKETQQP